MKVRLEPTINAVATGHGTKNSAENNDLKLKAILRANGQWNSSSSILCEQKGYKSPPTCLPPTKLKTPILAT